MNTNFGKIVEGHIRWGENPLYLDGFMIANPKAEHYRRAGYKPVTHTEMPTEEGYTFTAKYTDEGEYILEAWEKHPIEE